jgi:hypothetical protein
LFRQFVPARSQHRFHGTDSKTSLLDWAGEPSKDEEGDVIVERKPSERKPSERESHR